MAALFSLYFNITKDISYYQLKLCFLVDSLISIKKVGRLKKAIYLYG